MCIYNTLTLINKSNSRNIFTNIYLLISLNNLTLILKYPLLKCVQSASVLSINYISSSKHVHIQ